MARILPVLALVLKMIERKKKNVCEWVFLATIELGLLGFTALMWVKFFKEFC